MFPEKQVRTTVLSLDPLSFYSSLYSTSGGGIEQDPDIPRTSPTNPVTTAVERWKAFETLLTIDYEPVERAGDEQEESEPLPLYVGLPQQASAVLSESHVPRTSDVGPDPGAFETNATTAEDEDPAATAQRDEPGPRRSAPTQPRRMKPPQDGTTMNAEDLPEDGALKPALVPGNRSSRLMVEITRVEKGYWLGVQAQFVRLSVKHFAALDNELERLRVQLKVKPAHDATCDVGEQLPAGGPSSAPVGTPRIVAYAPSGLVATADPSALVGHSVVNSQTQSVGMERNVMFGKEWTANERFRLQSVLECEVPDAFEGLGPATIKNVLNVYSVANPQYRDGIPPLNIGLVVLTNGAPFDLSVIATLTPRSSRPVRLEPFPKSRPARFAMDGLDFIPHGESPLKIDFGSREMFQKWQDLIPLTGLESSALVGHNGLTDLADVIDPSNAAVDPDDVDNFRDEALLRSYCRSSIEVDEHGEAIHDNQARERAPTSERSKSRPFSDVASGRPLRGVSIEVTRAEAGLWTGEKAHFIMLSVEHASRQIQPLDSMAIHIEINGVSRDVSLSGGRMAGGLIGDHETLPRIVAHAPHFLRVPLHTDRGKVDGILVGLEPSPPLRVDRARMEARLLLAGRVHGRGDERVTDKLSFQAMTNPTHSEDLPALTIGLVVVSFGLPFTLSADVSFDALDPDARVLPLKSKRHPAKFAYEGVELRPHGEKKIQVDFASREMEEIWARVRTLVETEPYVEPVQSAFRPQSAAEGQKTVRIKPKPAEPRGSRSGPTDAIGSSKHTGTPANEAEDSFTDDEDGFSFADLDWSEEAMMESLGPREVIAQPVTETAEQKAAWDKLFGDHEWPEDADSGHPAPLDAGGSSSSQTQASRTTSGRRTTGKGRDRALKDFVYAGKLEPTDPDASAPQIVLDKQLANGLRIIGEVTRVQSGNYRGEPAIFMGLVVHFLNDDDAHTVKASSIRVRVFNVPTDQWSIQDALVAPSASLLATSGVMGPAHLSPIVTPTPSRQATPVLSQGDPSANMPGAYPVSSLGSTHTPNISPTVSSSSLPTVSATSAPSRSSSLRGQVPSFVEHRPEHIIGPSRSDLETIQNNLGGQIGTPENAFVTAMLNAARQVTRQHVLERYSEVVVELQPYQRRLLGPTIDPNLANVRNLLRARASTNPYHQSGFKEIRLGTVVMSNLRPFVVTVEVDCRCKNSIHVHARPYTAASPAQIAHGQLKHPPDEQPISVDDFSCAAMEWDTLVPLLEGFIRVPRGTTQ